MIERTVLHAAQLAIGGKYVDFHGWDMPVQFSGITAEHLAVRTACGVFDLGHMGRLRCAGARALDFLERVVTRALASMQPGQVRYGLVLAADGTIEDDVLVSRESADAWHLVVNASNREKLLGLWLGDLPAGVTCTDLTKSQAMIAVQGPTAAAVLAQVGLAARPDPVTGKPLKYYHFQDLAWSGTTVRLSRTGYTGEDGYECFVPTAHAEALWRAVVAAGALPCGLGARDTLRLEAGMPLYGNELDRSTTPDAANLGFALNPRGGYIGAEAASPSAVRLVGVRCSEKRVPRTSYRVFHAGQDVGRITSGTLSPTLGQPIGMAYVTTALAVPGTVVQIDIRGTLVNADIVALPFYKRAL